VLDAATAQRAVDAGARFVVSPTVEPEVLAVTAAAGVASLPGAMTPTEVLAAWRLGASAVKLFPASAVGPSFVRELHGPLPDVPIVPTGGISAADAAAYLEAGAVAVGIGGWLTGSGDPSIVRERARALAAAVGAGRGLASGR
jgi:2-dehydro-3-deoxyphosphogluconate aldolase/(4S)-4-hydroxy-2-oxoglutarate aldolase